jgi:hypothetical protein
MTMDWPALAAGAGLGVVLGGAAAWKLSALVRKRSELRALNRDYRSLNGQYLVYSVRADGTQEPTGGTVDVAWEAKEGLLEASAFATNGHPEWHSYLRMSHEYPGTGAGNYNNSNSIHGGVVQVIYVKQTRSFYAMGVTPARREFSQCWKAKG